MYKANDNLRILSHVSSNLSESITKIDNKMDLA